MTTLREDVLELFSQYWELAHREGKDGVNLADEANEVLHKLRAALAAEQGEPPPECQTEGEKKAFAFGWWKALEAKEAQANQPQPDAERMRVALDAIYNESDECREAVIKHYGVNHYQPQAEPKT